MVQFYGIFDFLLTSCFCRARVNTKRFTILTRILSYVSADMEPRLRRFVFNYYLTVYDSSF